MQKLMLTLGVIGATAVVALSAQGPPDGARGPRPFPPLVRVLDTDRNGTISAEEIAGAPAALLTLDANKDGQLSREELGPRFGRGRGGPGGRRGGGAPPERAPQ